MAAKDYKICPALFHAYFAKVSKRDPNLMLEDKRIITDAEIFTLIEWKLQQFCVDNNTELCILREVMMELLLKLKQLEIC